MEHTFVLHQNRLVTIGAHSSRSAPSSASSSPVAGSTPSPTVESPTHRHSLNASQRPNPSQYIPPSGHSPNTHRPIQCSPPECHTDNLAPFNNPWQCSPFTQPLHPSQQRPTTSTPPIIATTQAERPHSPEISAQFGFVLQDAWSPQYLVAESPATWSPAYQGMVIPQVHLQHGYVSSGARDADVLDGGLIDWGGAPPSTATDHFVGISELELDSWSSGYWAYAPALGTTAGEEGGMWGLY